ncbi:flagellar motor protein MotB [Roseicyclus sp.]|uniref:flagellar motor protein MotB n=1 Tax=Roseicyclus sp. TaxID=1914329 RepID=UPI003F6AACDC
MAEAIEANEEPEEEECPKCPPPGAPAWMATFADMATLLMAFFVLILSFAEFNTPKFKQISGSLQNAFGVQRVIPVVEQPMGTTVISMEFSPSPSPSVTNEMTQDTTELERPEIEIKTDEDEAPEGGDQGVDGTTEGSGGEQESAPDGQSGAQADTLDAAQLAQALDQAIQSGEVSIEMAGENVVINFPSEDTAQKDLPSLIEETLAALAEARQASGKAESEVLFGGLEQQLAELAAAARQPETSLGQAELERLEQQQAEAQESAEKAAIARDLLTVALRQELGEGLVEVEQREDKVLITVGAGGAFPSGSADLTAAALDIMSRIAFTAMGESSTIVVAGHTDNVPIRGGVFRDNWDLAAARAASVVQSIESTGLVQPGRMQAVSYGETQPVDSNDTDAGRERNRRIEISIEY